jgi:hypothetical protein
MSINPNIWGDWVNIAIENIDAGTRIDDEDSGDEQLLNHMFNNQEILREFQIDTQFDTSTTSASYVTVVTREIWLPDWLDQPVSGKWSEFLFQIFAQSYKSAGTSYDIRMRLNTGSWEEQTGLTRSAWGAPDLFQWSESIGDWDPDALAGTVVDLEIQAKITGGGTVYLRDRGGTSFVRRVGP